MMSDITLEIPRRLNDPPRFFWWDLEPALVALAAALAGMMAGYFLTGCALGVLLATAYAQTRTSKHPGFALHLLYWHLPGLVTGLKCTPPSHLREFLG